MSTTTSSAASSAIRSLLQEHGASIEGEDAAYLRAVADRLDSQSEGAYAKLEEKAEQLRKSDSTISQGDALAKAMRENPALERQYLIEARGSVR